MIDSKAVTLNPKDLASALAQKFNMVQEHQ